MFNFLQTAGLIHLRPGQRTAPSEVSRRRERLRRGTHYKESCSELERADKVKQERGEREEATS